MPDTKKFTYRNQSKYKVAVVGVGEVEPGKTINSDVKIENPNLVLETGGRMVNVEKPVEQPTTGKTVKGKE